MTVQWMRSSFGDLSYEVEDAIAEDDRVVLRVISRGLQTGEFMAFPAIGKELAVKQIHVYRIVDGKVLEHWAVRDDLGQGIQLGFIPGGGPPGAARPPESWLPTGRSAEPAVDVYGRPLARTAQIPVGGRARYRRQEGCDHAAGSWSIQRLQRKLYAHGLHRRRGE